MPVTVHPAPANGTSTPVWVPAQEFSTTGTSAMGNSLGVVAIRTGSMLFDGATDETAVATPLVPVGWESVNVDIWWANAGAGAGDVTWRCPHQRIAAGTTMNTETTPANVVATAGAQNVVKVTRLLAGITVAPGELLRLEVGRYAASDASDTLGNDVGMLGVSLGKA